jgi:rubrerythrin
MQRLCDDCQGVFKNKQSLHAHQNRTGHQQHDIANNERTNIAIGQEESEEGKLTPNEAISELNENVEDLYGYLNDTADVVEKNNANIANLANKYDALKVSVDSFNNTLNGLSNWSEAQWKNALSVIATVDAANTKKFSKLHICPDCGASLHLHRSNDSVNSDGNILQGKSWHLECPICGYYSINYLYPTWKAEGGTYFPAPKKHDENEQNEIVK